MGEAADGEALLRLVASLETTRTSRTSPGSPSSAKPGALRLAERLRELTIAIYERIADTAAANGVTSRVATRTLVPDTASWMKKTSRVISMA